MKLYVYFIIVFSPIQIFAQTWKDENSQGMHYYQQGEYDKAIESYSKALNKCENISDELVIVLNNLSYAYKAIGEYAKSIECLENALQSIEQIHGRTHSDFIEIQISLANIYLTNGQYELSENTLLEAQELMNLIATKQPEHYHQNNYLFFNLFITLQNSLASLDHKKGQIKEAIARLEQIVNIIKNNFPNDYEEDYYYQQAIGNLSNYYLEMGLPEKAKPLAIDYVNLTKNNPDNLFMHLAAKQTLGNLHRTLGEYEQAIEIWQLLLEKINNSPYKKSDLHIETLDNLGELYIELEKYELAISNINLSKTLQEQRTSLQLRLYQTTLFNLAGAYHLHGNYPIADSIYSIVMNTLIDDVINHFSYLSDQEKKAFYNYQRFFIEEYFYFALSVSGLVNLQETTKPYINHDISSILYNLQIMTKALILSPSYKLRSRIDASTDQTSKENYLDWVSKKEALALLISNSTTQSETIQNLEKEIEHLEKTLIKSSKDFSTSFKIASITWKDIQKKLKPNEAAVEMIRMADGLIYLALIVTPTCLHPEMVLIKSSADKHLEKEYYSFYKNNIKQKLTDSISYNIYFKPISDKIHSLSTTNNQITQLYFSPDGIYNQININTLFNTESDQYVIDEIEIRTLTNTKEILNNKDKPLPTDKSITLMGNPRFSTDSNVYEIFTELPGTKKEINQIASILKKNGWKTSIYEGLEADEYTLKNTNNTRVLHIASHGFFHDNKEEDPSLVQMLLKSGIALSGANNQNISSGEDGILTAYEALNLSLENTELVVLSACETGLGSTRPGEGVYGLKRALDVAGARLVMMSLWKVDDEATQELMTEFYKEWIKIHDIRIAFKNAQSTLKKKYTHPYYWGAFILCGY